MLCFLICSCCLPFFFSSLASRVSVTWEAHSSYSSARCFTAFIMGNSSSSVYLKLQAQTEHWIYEVGVIIRHKSTSDGPEHSVIKYIFTDQSLLTASVYQRQRDLLQCVVVDGAGAEVTGVVQTDQYSWAAGTGDGRQVTGGPAPGTLPLIILEVIIFCRLLMQHSLKAWDNNRGVKKQIHTLSLFAWANMISDITLLNM